MDCIKCGTPTEVLDKRGNKRRRNCPACGTRFSTIETVTESKRLSPEELKQKLMKRTEARRALEEKKDLASMFDELDDEPSRLEWECPEEVNRALHLED